MCQDFLDIQYVYPRGINRIFLNQNRKIFIILVTAPVQVQSLIKSSQCKQCWAVHTGRVHNWRGKRTVPVLAIGRIQHYHIPYHIIYLTSFPPSCSLVNIYQSYYILLIFAIVHCLASLALQIHCVSIYGLLPGPIQPTFYSLPKIVSVKIMVT